MISRQKRYWLFRLAGVLLPLAALVAVDQVLHAVFPYQGEMGYLRKAEGDPPLYYLERGKPRIFGELPKNKEKNAVRIFTFGGSAAWGLPYGAGGSFSGWLAEILGSLQPLVKVEVINTGYPSAPLATARDFAEASIAFKPDIFIMDNGHNEFLLENQVLRETAMDPRWVHWLRRKLRYRSFLYFQLDRWYSRLRAKSLYRLENVRFEDYGTKVDDQFKSELRSIITLARRHKVKLVILTEACNELDYAPMQSWWQPGLDSSEIARCEGLLAQIRRAIREDRVYDAEKAYGDLCALSPGYAQATYELAQMYLRRGEGLRARQAFRRAKEEDRTLVRVKARFNAILRREVLELDPRDVALVDVERLFAQASPQGIPGDNLFMDGMHPNLQGHFLIAGELAKLLIQRGWVPVSRGLPPRLEFSDFRKSNRRVNDDAVLETAGYFVGLRRFAAAEKIYQDYLRQHDHWLVHVSLAVIALEKNEHTRAEYELAHALRLLNGNSQPIIDAAKISYAHWVDEFEKWREDADKKNKPER